MRVLITGGAGYIGRFCARRLVEAGHSILSLDRRPHAPGEERRVMAVQGDIADRRLLESLLEAHAIDAVVHLAGEKSVSDAMSLPGPHLTNNVSGTFALLEAMRLAGVDKIVFSSSAAVYGTPDRLPVDESAALRPENPYGAGKAMVEEALRWYHVCHGFDSVILRYFNAAGAADDGSMGEDPSADGNLIPRVMRALVGLSGPVEVYGANLPTPDGTPIRDYVHVDDLAIAHVSALEHVARRPGVEVINLGSGRGASVREVLRAAEAAAGRPVPYRDAPQRAGDPAAVWAAVGKADRILGWRARRDLHDIAATSWRWYRRAVGV